MKTVILANGQFPTHNIPLQLLHQADRLICCDGALDKLINHDAFNSQQPLTIIGDGDSIDPTLRAKFKDKFIHVSDQYTNDLTKAINLCEPNATTSVDIIGATGLRDDHNLANISLLSDYSVKCPFPVRMVTDYGIFTPISSDTTFKSFARQQVSIFTFDSSIQLTFEGLEYPLDHCKLTRLWQGSLNASLGDSFTIKVSHGPVLVYQTYDPK